MQHLPFSFEDIGLLETYLEDVTIGVLAPEAVVPFSGDLIAGTLVGALTGLLETVDFATKGY